MELLLAADSISQKEPIMTTLRQRMTEDMQVRNLSPHTQTSYVQQVSLFARHFNRSPEALGPEDIRYLSGLSHQRKEVGPWLDPHRCRRPALSLQDLAQKGVAFR
jgi:hypothetical protein